MDCNGVSSSCQVDKEVASVVTLGADKSAAVVGGSNGGTAGNSIVYLRSVTTFAARIAGTIAKPDECPALTFAFGVHAPNASDGTCPDLAPGDTPSGYSFGSELSTQPSGGSGVSYPQLPVSPSPSPGAQYCAYARVTGFKNTLSQKDNTANVQFVLFTPPLVVFDDNAPVLTGGGTLRQCSAAVYSASGGCTTSAAYSCSAGDLYFVWPAVTDGSGSGVQSLTLTVSVTLNGATVVGSPLTVSLAVADTRYSNGTHWNHTLQPRTVVRAYLTATDYVGNVAVFQAMNLTLDSTLPQLNGAIVNGVNVSR